MTTSTRRDVGPFPVGATVDDGEGSAGGVALSFVTSHGVAVVDVVLVEVPGRHVSCFGATVKSNREHALVGIDGEDGPEVTVEYPEPALVLAAEYAVSGLEDPLPGIEGGSVEASRSRDMGAGSLVEFGNGVVATAVMRVLEPAETKALAEAIDVRYRAMVLLAAYTGLRFGELGTLRTERFDALRRTIRIEESLAEVRGEFFVKPPKSSASSRTVSVPSFVVEELARHIAQYTDGSELIFSAPSGGPIRRTNFRRRICVPAVRASVGGPCTFHDLRHTHAALPIAQGEHPKVIQERLGHASIKTTLDTYGHLFDGLDEAAADRLDASWRDSRVDAMWTRSNRDVIELSTR